LLSVVLDNLVSNALKYGPRRGGRVVIAAQRRSERWRISVTSGGMPIPADEAARIFQPFHRVPGERRVPGIGLGLTICARLMERLDGTIGVEAGAEDGNTFWIELRPAS
jgi:signal transduction histidine kinase